MSDASDSRPSEPEQQWRLIQNRIAGVAWGTFLLWVGLCFLLEISTGLTLLGIGVITLGAQGVRRMVSLHTEGFWVFVGLMFALAGVWELFAIGTPLLPVVAVLCGIALILASIRKFGGTRKSKPSTANK